MMLYCNAWVLTTALIWPRLPQYNTQQHTLVIIDRSLVGGQNSTATTVLAQSLKRKTSRFLILNLVNPPWLNRLHRIRNYKSLRCACKKVVLKIPRFVSVTESSHWTFFILPFFTVDVEQITKQMCVFFIIRLFFSSNVHKCLMRCKSKCDFPMVRIGASRLQKYHYTL